MRILLAIIHMEGRVAEREARDEFALPERGGSMS